MPLFTPLINDSAPAARNAASIAYNKSTRIPPICTILDNWILEKFILAVKLFAKALQIFETYVSVNNVLCGKLASNHNCQSHSMKNLKLLEYDFLFQIITYYVAK